jgi:hypothetical protein
VVKRHKRIRFRVVGRSVTDGCRIGYDREAADATFFETTCAVGEFGDQINPADAGQAESVDVGGVDEQDPPSACDAAIAGGFTEKQKQAFYVLWSRLADHFTMPDDTPVTNLATFPADFDAMVRYVDDYQARPWPVHPPGHDSTTSAIEHFAKRFFPPPLHWFGRALVTSFMAPAVLSAHDIDAPAPATAWLARHFM